MDDVMLIYRERPVEVVGTRKMLKPKADRASRVSGVPLQLVSAQAAGGRDEDAGRAIAATDAAAAGLGEAESGACPSAAGGAAGCGALSGDEGAGPSRVVKADAGLAPGVASEDGGNELEGEQIVRRTGSSGTTTLSVGDDRKLTVAHREHVSAVHEEQSASPPKNDDSANQLVDREAAKLTRTNTISGGRLKLKSTAKTRSSMSVSVEGSPRSKGVRFSNMSTNEEIQVNGREEETEGPIVRKFCWLCSIGRC